MNLALSVCHFFFMPVNYNELREQATEKEINELHQRRIQQSASVDDGAGEDIDGEKEQMAELYIGH